MHSTRICERARPWVENERLRIAFRRLRRSMGSRRVTDIWQTRAILFRDGEQSWSLRLRRADRRRV